MAEVKIKFETNNSDYVVDRFNGLSSIESISQSTSDPKGIQYGVLANTGTAKIIDANGQIADMLESGDMPVSNINTELYLNNKLAQSHITNDSDYDNVDKIFTVQFTNTLSQWDTIQYNGYAYPEVSKTAYEILKSVLSNYYTDNYIEQMLSKQIIYGELNELGTVKSYLNSIVIPYPYLEADTLKNTIDKFCNLAELQVYQSDGGQIYFVSARPIVQQSSLNNAFVVPKYLQYDEFKKAVILRNKYDAVEINEKQVNDIIDYNAIVGNKIITSFSDLETNTNNDSKGQLKSFASSTASAYGDNYTNVVRASACYIENKYISGSFTIDATTPDGLEIIKQIYTYNNGGLKFSVTYNEKVYEPKLDLYNFSIGQHTNNNFTFNINSVGWDNIDGTIKSGDIITQITKTGAQSDVNTEATLTNHSTATITYDSVLNKYIINYTLVVCANTYSASGENITSTSYPQTQFSLMMSGSVTKIEPLEVNVSLYGDKRIISFADISVSDSNVSTAKNVVSVSGSELLQSGTMLDETKMSTIIKSNIHSDYANGIADATLRVIPYDMQSKNGTYKKNWANGDVLEVGDLVEVAGESNKTWNITSRAIKYEGAPYIDLQLQERKGVQVAQRLATPTISISNNRLSISSVSHAQKYSIYVNGTLYEQITSGEASRGYYLPARLTTSGSYVIKVKATATGYIDSLFSSELTYSKYVDNETWVFNETINSSYLIDETFSVDYFVDYDDDYDQSDIIRVSTSGIYVDGFYYENGQWNYIASNNRKITLISYTSSSFENWLSNVATRQT